MFNDEEAKDLRATYGATFAVDGMAAAVMAVARRTVELLAARSGTMTVGRVSQALLATFEESEILSDELREHLAAQGARVAALEQHVSELEKSLENARQSAEVWRKRVEAAADALADVLPGEVGRLDLLARIAEVKRLLDGYGEELNTYIKAGVDVAKILDGEDGFLGEGIVTGAMRVVAERNEAVADNAALVVVLRDAAGDHEKADACLWCGKVPPIHADRCKFDLALEDPHPGAALLERMKRLEGALRHIGVLAEHMTPDTMAGVVLAIVSGALDGATQPQAPDRETLEARATDAYRRAKSVEPRHVAQMVIQILLNGRWGTCVFCPRDADGRPHPERCPETERGDHNIPADH